MNQHFKFFDEYKDAHLKQIDITNDKIQILSQWNNNPKRILYVYGGVGVGKTHFAAAIYNFLIEKNVNPFDIRVYSERTFLDDLKSEIDKGFNSDSRIEIICQTKFLILDDLGSCLYSDWNIRSMCHLIDIRSHMDFPTLITSNLDPRMIREKLGERAWSRLFRNKNTIIEITGPDRRLNEERV